MIRKLRRRHMKENEKERLDHLQHLGLTTKAELVDLLLHDFGHMVFHVIRAVDELIAISTKALQEGRPPDCIESAAQHARGVCAELVQSIGLLQRPFAHHDNKVRFQLGEILKETIQVIAPVLQSANMAVDLRIPQGTKCFGFPSLLQQIFLNLLINSVNAQQSPRTHHKNTIHIVARESPSKVVIQFWDEGPGISTTFPNASDIFTIGRSSHTNRGGTGLPLVRALIETHFQGQISLKDPTRALFEIVIPHRQQNNSDDEG